MPTFLHRTEIFWIGFSAISSAATLLVVFFYTLYTRKMMRMQMETRTADYTPNFSPREFVVTPAHLGFQKGGVITHPNIKTIAMTVRNIGRGPAVMVQAWHQPVSAKFLAGRTGVLTPTDSSAKGEINLHELMSSEVAPVSFGPFDTRERWLFAISCVDTIGGSHQLQIVLEKNGDSQWTMVHNTGNTWQERAVRFITKFVDVLEAIDKQSKRLIS